MAPAVDSAEHGYSQVVHGFDDVEVSDGDVVAPALIPRALTAGELVFSDGATQVFEADGGTTYVENVVRPAACGTSTTVTSVRSGRPATAPATTPAGWSRTAPSLSSVFTELGRGSRFDGRYRD
jgi:hypothetical protein